MAICTLFSVTDTDLTGSAGEMTLPSYDDRTSGMGATFAQPHTLELGTTWDALHRALGAHAEDEPLGFLAGGGEPFAALDDGVRSSGRHFAPPATIKLLAAVAKINDDYLMRNIAKLRVDDVSFAELWRVLARVRIFLAEAVEGERGLIVHKLL